MDKYVVKVQLPSMPSPATPKAKKETSKKGDVGVKQRHSQFPNATHVSGNKLFCTTCNIVIDHTRKSSVEAHMKTEKHGSNKRRLENQENQSTAKKQRTIEHSSATPSPSQSHVTVASQERTELCQEWISMCAAANIPLSKSDHPAVRAFLQKHVVGGGAIPGARQLQACYLQREYHQRVEATKEFLANKPVSIICDEMSDDLGRFVLNILAAPLEPVSTGEEKSVKSILLETTYLESTNHTTVSQAVVAAVSNYGIAFNNIISVNTDNAGYMKKAYKEVFKCLFPNSVHITCLAHIMNLFGDSFKKPFKKVNKFVKAFSAMFWHAGARKARYMRHQRDCCPSTTPTMAPNPVGTRWNCWFDAVKYHVAHFETYKAFVDEEIRHAGAAAPDSLLTLKETLDSDHEVRLLKAQMNFIVDKCKPFVEMTDIFQSNRPLATSAYSMLEDLHFMYEKSGVRMAEASQYFVEEGLSSNDKHELQALFSEAYALTAAKIEKYMTEDGQPGIHFLKDIRYFAPSNLQFVTRSQMTTIPQLSGVPEIEFAKYESQLAPEALRVSTTNKIDLEFFWNCAAESVPLLAKCAQRHMYVVINSADAERSFSLYNLIVSARRRSLSHANVKALLFLYYNDFAGKDFFN